MQLVDDAKAWTGAFVCGLSLTLVGCGGDKTPPAPPPVVVPAARPEALPAKVEPQPKPEELAKKQGEIEAAAAKILRDLGAAVRLNEAGQVVHVTLLNHPRCNDESLEPLKSLKSVTAIDLRGTKITDAALSIIGGLCGPDDVILIDSDSHASIYDATRQTTSQVVAFRHNSPESLRKKLERLKSQPEESWDLMWNSAIVYSLFPNTLLIVQGLADPSMLVEIEVTAAKA